MVTAVIGRLRAELRQRRQHPPFRIAEPDWDAALGQRLERVAARLAAADAEPTDAEPTDAEPTDAKPTDAKPTDAEPADAKPNGTEPNGAEPAEPAEPDRPQALDDRTLADSVTRLWSALRALDRAEGRPSREARQAARYLRNCLDTLAEGGLTVQDHDGQPFHPGLALEVLLYSEEGSVTHETVLETVRPSIYLAGRHVQMGQVIVGRPADPDHHAEDASA